MSFKRALIPAAAVVGLIVAVVLGHQRHFESGCAAQTRPGSLMSAPGGAVNVWCEGRGWPLVLLEASGLGDATQYERVMHAVGRRTTVCAWDRPGMGSSPTTTGKTSAPEQGERILAALSNSALSGPLVTVGASAGGLVSLYLARQHPDRVVGMVLVDALGPEAVERFAAPLAKVASSARWGAVGGRLGLLSLLNPLHLSERDACMTYWPEVFDAATDLLNGLPESARLVKSCPPLSPRMPLIVLRHGRPGDLVTGAGASAAEQAAAEPTWIALQQSLAAQSRDGRLRVVPKSGHLIAVEQPEAVVQAIDDVLDEIASPSIPPPRACVGRRSVGLKTH
jgi:pimeloyl-ACP methyl ester carboxylesterase